MTTLEQWLSEATRGLSAGSAARVRAEIQQHYDSACEAGDAAADVMRALGDPRAANRAYRKVLLTKSEALRVPTLTRRKPPSLPELLVTAALFAAIAGLGLASKHHDPGFWPILIALNCATPLSWFFLRTSIERIRIYVYVQAVRSLLVVAIAWWYQGWIGILVYGAMAFLFLSVDYYLTYRVWLIFRKLGLRT